MKKWNLSPAQTLLLFVLICLLLAGSTYLLAMGYLTSPSRQEVFKETVTARVLRVDEMGRAVRLTNVVGPEDSQTDYTGLTQLYAEIGSETALLDSWGTQIRLQDLAADQTVSVEIGDLTYQNEDLTIASAKVFSLTLEP